ncbi:branched-chain amino acid transport system ATP-binding protein [Rhizobium sp. BK347]|nr:MULTISPECIES: ABC transporter ATP-binding protein [unclassified Rhizobium]MBB3289075.1 branched-chain amino acid transport system ATP-binding protein [Rhizobium sp. BK252]MBB3403817.1 branched-chain amino acid transport system ATP-binding protein [Rhizobium sp. BK289]MBB3416514.1 branched-chain amino acid transport system ATP-binding protein [Rhizobium sp. BK284]MBB3484280.1 branched-chain amino acid transport system ATP-binding protein [Rhizobium sp. BK347]
MTADNSTVAPFFEVRNLNVFYGAIHAIRDISLQVQKGEIVTLIGSNGAGKTTTLGAISRLLPLKSGAITFDGRSLNGCAPHEVVKLGLAHVPERRRIFGDLTVLENLEMGGFTVSSKAEISRRIDKMLELFPRLAERRKQFGGTLSGGEQQMLAVARALMQDPQLLLLDEPSMGLPPLFVERIFDLIQDVNKTGVTIFLVEQNAHMRSVLPIAVTS